MTSPPKTSPYWPRAGLLLLGPPLFILILATQWTHFSPRLEVAIPALLWAWLLSGPLAARALWPNWSRHRWWKWTAAGIPLGAAFCYGVAIGGILLIRAWKDVERQTFALSEFRGPGGFVSLIGHPRTYPLCCSGDQMEGADRPERGAAQPVCQFDQWFMESDQ